MSEPTTFDARSRPAGLVAALALGLATVAVLHLPLAAVLWGGFNGFVAALVLIGGASFCVRRRTGLRIVWCVAVPAAVFCALTAPGFHRGHDVNRAVVAVYVTGYTILVALAATAGALLARRRERAHS
jgi:hypothetical protein